MRILCLFGHKWKNFGGNLSKAMNLAHLHSRAGNIDLCTRCGKVWDDFGGWVNIDAEAREYHKRKLGEIATYAQMNSLKLRGDWK